MTRKRSRGEFEERDSSAHIGLGETLARIKHDAESASGGPIHGSTQATPSDTDGWQVVGKRSKIKQRKIESEQSDFGDDKPMYPSITHAPQARLSSPVKLGDLQSMILYLLADGPAPQWVAIQRQASITKVVVLLVPGLQLAMFDDALPGSTPSAVFNNAQDDSQNDHSDTHRSPDEFYPRRLKEDLLPSALRPLARFFPHVWPIQAPGDSRMSRLWSPLAAILSAPLPKSKEETHHKGARPPREGKSWKNQPTPIADFIATVDQLSENNYVLHETLLSTDRDKQLERERRNKHNQTQHDGWIDTEHELSDGSSVEAVTNPSPQSNADEIKGDTLLNGRQVLALDCEMCQTGEERFELTRLSVLDWSGNSILDILVKPPNPVTNYLTQFSGITAEKLDPVTTTLLDAQKQLLALMKPDTILLGHSLNSDLNALKMIHPYIVDTTILYPHPGGSHLRSSLKWLSQKYLTRAIQGGTDGHDSIEDARAALDLVKLKCQKGPLWGTSEATQESIFKRISRSNHPSSSKSSFQGAVVDWGVPKRGHGAAADVCFGCDTDQEVVEGVKRAVNGDKDGKEVPGGGVTLVWARLRELEAVRGWWETSKTADNDALRDRAKASSTNLSDAVVRSVAHIEAIYDSLPARTAFIVYSGTGNPIELRNWQAVHQQFKDEYKVKKWDELSVKWTDDEEQSLRKAFKVARGGCGFITVK